MSSIRKIAQLAGVSRTTVCRALHDAPDVSPDTAQRIRDLAALCHYRPNRLSNSLFTDTSMVLGFLMPEASTPFYNRILRGFMDRVTRDGYQVIVVQTHHALDRTCAALELLVEQRVDGVVLASGLDEPIPMKSLLELLSHHVAPVAIDVTVAPRPIDHVHTNEEALAQMGVDYLLGLGHRRIAYVGPKFAEPPSRRWGCVRAALRQKGLPCALGFDTKTYHMAQSPTIGDALPTLLATPHAPTALFAFSDEIAGHLLQQARGRGLRVPEELSILGCSNSEFSALLSPPLSTIEQFPEEIGQHTADTLLRRIREQKAHPDADPAPAVLRQVNPKLVQRRSCAPPRRGG
jgi:DNA-binding LacI/PurR family transcriptional regulator